MVVVGVVVGSVLKSSGKWNLESGLVEFPLYEHSKGFLSFSI